VKQLGSIVVACFSAVLLTACGGGNNIGPLGGYAASLVKHSKTFTYTGALQTFIVPNVRRLRVAVSGAVGWPGCYGRGGGGVGGLVKATIPVTVHRTPKRPQPKWRWSGAAAPPDTALSFYLGSDSHDDVGDGGLREIRSFGLQQRPLFVA
jgi:hypothetical protein